MASPTNTWVKGTTETGLDYTHSGIWHHDKIRSSSTTKKMPCKLLLVRVPPDQKKAAHCSLQIRLVCTGFPLIECLAQYRRPRPVTLNHQAAKRVQGRVRCARSVQQSFLFLWWESLFSVNILLGWPNNVRIVIHKLVYQPRSDITFSMPLISSFFFFFFSL